MLTVDEARARIIAMAPPLAATGVALEEAGGLVLAEDVMSTRALPPFDNSAMDGYAVRLADVRGATAESPARLRVIGEAAAGSVFDGVVEAGSAVRIMTGAPIPPGAEAVIEVEETDSADGMVNVRRAPEARRSFREAGSDIRPGDVALTAGTYLGPSQIALLASLGVSQPRCIARPRIAVVATGDELVDHTVEPGPAQVVDITTPAMAEAVRSVGAEPHVVERARDTRHDLRRAFLEAASADMVVSVGGVSMGEYDLVRGVVMELGELDFWQVAMRPGKPLAVGRVRSKPFIGLPGNPVSALVGFEVYLVPLIVGLSGRAGWSRPTVEAELADPVKAPAGLRTFARAQLETRTGSRPLAHPAKGQASYQIRSLATSDALLDIPAEETELAAGATVRAIRINLPPGPPV